LPGLASKPTWFSMVQWLRAVRMNFLIGQPVVSSIRRLTASAAKTMVRLAMTNASELPRRFRHCCGVRRAWWISPRPAMTSPP